MHSFQEAALLSRQATNNNAEEWAPRSRLAAARPSSPPPPPRPPRDVCLSSELNRRQHTTDKDTAPPRRRGGGRWWSAGGAAAVGKEQYDEIRRLSDFVVWRRRRRRGGGAHRHTPSSSALLRLLGGIILPRLSFSRSPFGTTHRHQGSRCSSGGSYQGCQPLLLLLLLQAPAPGLNPVPPHKPHYLLKSRHVGDIKVPNQDLERRGAAVDSGVRFEPPGHLPRVRVAAPLRSRRAGRAGKSTGAEHQTGQTERKNSAVLGAAGGLDRREWRSAS